MRITKIQNSLGYNIIFEHNCLDKIGKLIEEKTFNKVLIITDDHVDKLYKTFFDNLEFQYHKYIIPSGESSKNINQYYSIIRYLTSLNYDRHDLIIAFGGGVVGDLSGFVASTYMRGIDYIQVPTTLLSMVDSSIGSKTAINSDDGKNLIGTFYSPIAVFIDPHFIDTLPIKEINNGVAEIIKYSVIKDKTLFDLLMDNSIYETSILDKAIRRSIQIKKEIIEIDLYESYERQLLNFGHTLGHAIETISNYSIPHGYAVAIGMAMITKAYYRSGKTSYNTYLGLVELLKKYKLPSECSYGANQLYSEILKDKKNNGNKINLVYPVKIGKALIESVEKQKVKLLIDSCI